MMGNETTMRNGIKDRKWRFPALFEPELLIETLQSIFPCVAFSEGRKRGVAELATLYGLVIKKFGTVRLFA